MKLRRKICLGLGVVAMLLALLLVAMHYRAKAALAAYKRQLREQGEKLTIEELIPPRATNGPNGAAAFIVAASRLPTFNYSNQPALMKAVNPGRARVAWAQPILASMVSTNDVWPGLKVDLERNREALAEVKA